MHLDAVEFLRQRFEHGGRRGVEQALQCRGNHLQIAQQFSKRTLEVDLAEQCAQAVVRDTRRSVHRVVGERLFVEVVRSAGHAVCVVVALRDPRTRGIELGLVDHSGLDDGLERILHRLLGRSGLGLEERQNCQTHVERQRIAIELHGGLCRLLHLRRHRHRADPRSGDVGTVLAGPVEAADHVRQVRAVVPDVLHGERDALGQLLGEHRERVPIAELHRGVVARGLRASLQLVERAGRCGLNLLAARVTLETRWRTRDVIDERTNERLCHLSDPVCDRHDVGHGRLDVLAGGLDRLLQRVQHDCAEP